MQDALDLGSLLPAVYTAPDVSSVLGAPLEVACSGGGIGPNCKNPGQ
jgi:hypothetical protein